MCLRFSFETIRRLLSAIAFLLASVIYSASVYPLYSRMREREIDTFLSDSEKNRTIFGDQTFI